jgi:predicted dehydrogenase
VHVRVLGGVEGVDGVACYDAVFERAATAAREFNATAAPDLDTLIGEVDALVVAVPTSDHCDVAMRALERGRDVFVEKPIARTPSEAERMIEAARTRARILQVGHVERFNGAVEAVWPWIEEPTFIEIHRLAPFNVRGTDVSVVGDLMIHDLDLLCHLLDEWPSEIRVAGAAILTGAADIVNARLEYPGGCVANVTASRVTMTPMRKVRVFSPRSYISIDLLAGRATRYRKAAGFERGVEALRSKTQGHESLDLRDFIEVETVSSDGAEPLHKELTAFCRSVVTREPPPVTGEDGLKAVRLATDILARMKTAGGG